MKMTAIQNMVGVVLLSVVALVAAFEPSVAKETSDGSSCPACELATNEPCFTDEIRDACEPGYHQNYDGKCGNKENPVTRRACCPCEENSYQPRHNKCKCCIACTNCSKNGTEVVSRCNITHDAVCGQKLSPATTQEETTAATTTVEAATDTTTVATTTTDGGHHVPPRNVTVTGISLEWTCFFMFIAFATGCFVTTVFWIWHDDWFHSICDRFNHHVCMLRRSHTWSR